MDGGVDGGIGRGFWLKGAGLVIGLGVLALIVFVIIDGLMYRFGAIAALLLVFGVLMLVAYISDTKKQRDYDKPDG